MDRYELKSQNQQFANTNGISPNNVDQGFKPAFCEGATGRIELARYPDGRSAPMHLISGLPREWASEFDNEGGVLSLKPGIVAGFCKNGEFFTREQAVKACE